MHLWKQNKEKALGENRLILYLFSKSLVLEMMDLCSGGWFRSIIKCTWLIKGHAPKTGVLLLLLATLMQSNQHRWQTNQAFVKDVGLHMDQQNDVWLLRMSLQIDCSYLSYLSSSTFFCTEDSIMGRMEWSSIRYQNKLQCPSLISL